MTRGEWRAYLVLGRTDKSLSKLHGEAGRIVDFAIMAAAGLLAAGVLLPFLNVNRLYIFSESHSLVEISAGLFGSGEFFLAGVVVLFSIIVPIAKLDSLYRIWALKAHDDPGLEKHLRVLHFFGKWSMLEVFVGAVAVFAMKASFLGSASAQPGIYCFAGSAVLAMILSHKIGNVVEARKRP